MSAAKRLYGEKAAIQRKDLAASDFRLTLLEILFNFSGDGSELLLPKLLVFELGQVRLYRQSMY